MPAIRLHAPGFVTTLKELTWPDAKTTAALTLACVLGIAVAGTVIYGLDIAFSAAMSLI